MLSLTTLSSCLHFSRNTRLPTYTPFHSRCLCSWRPLLKRWWHPSHHLLLWYSRVHLLQIQSYTLLQLIPLAVLGAFGKTIGAIIVYIISDKAEDVVMTRFGKFFNVTHDDVERFGKKLGKGPRDYFLLTGLRALPIMPSVLLSVGSGLLKVPMRVFIVSTFLGTIVCDGVYLYAGYVGTEALAAFVNLSSHLESYVEVLIVLVLNQPFGFLVQKKKEEFAAIDNFVTHRGCFSALGRGV